MSDILLKCEGVGKKFTRNLRQSMVYGLQDVARCLVGKPAATQELRSGEFWSLENVSFELRRGECLGVIGPNGAGKSTLLKILNGIFLPDRGRVEIHGRVGALIELGAGFHPALTGRENIYVNGAILGFSKKEIDRKLDQIIDFSEIEEFIDAPVRTYSSGMAVKLGFAIAAQMEPDVLIIDEVLAVGDAGFRAKCYDQISRMLNVCGAIFVSHNMQWVSKMCRSCLVLNKGKDVFSGPSSNAVNAYFKLFAHEDRQVYGDELRLIDFLVEPRNSGRIVLSRESELRISLELVSEIAFERGTIHIDILKPSGEFVAEWNSRFNGYDVAIRKGPQKFQFVLKEINLSPGLYYLSLVVTPENALHNLLWVHKGWMLEVCGEFSGGAPYQILGTMEPVPC